MISQRKEIVEKHIKTHTERSADDHAAVIVLETFLRTDGKINTNFSCDDKWPNIDGTFEFVSEPEVSGNGLDSEGNIYRELADIWNCLRKKSP